MAKFDAGNRNINPRTKNYFGNYGVKFIAGLTCVGAIITLVVSGGDFFLDGGQKQYKPERRNDNGGNKPRRN